MSRLTLSRKAQQKARGFIYEQARPLERALYAFHFESAPASGVLSELAKFTVTTALLSVLLRAIVAVVVPLFSLSVD